MIINILLPISLVFIMFTLGMGLTIQDFKNVINTPKAFAVGIVNQMIVLPIITFLILSVIVLPKELAVGMMILACCPGGVTSNILTKFAKGDTALSISLTAIMSIVTVITLPLIVGFSMEYFIGEDAPEMSVILLCAKMFLLTTVPVTIGLYINSKYNHFSKSFLTLANKISMLLFILIVVGALSSEWEKFINNIGLLGPSILLLIIVMLFIGYNSSSWFNLNNKQGITVAIESGVQNATVGITIGNLILNQENISILSLPSGVYGILMYVVCIPFVIWVSRKKS